MNTEILEQEPIIDKSWSFTECSPSQTSYISHGYYTYPAKFIPQLANRLIQKYSKENDTIVDPFLGSGTTLVESLVHNRIGIGTDINEIAALVAKVKTTPLSPTELGIFYIELEKKFKNRIFKEREIYLTKANEKFNFHQRIEYWFKITQKEDLSILLYVILEIQEENFRNFFLVAFSQILKTCSIWLQKSIKPTRDLKKKEYHVIDVFSRQIKKMIKRNAEFYDLIKKNNQGNATEKLTNIDKYRKVICADARKIPTPNESINLIVTSPPYVTSYEYADLHQLPSYWLGYLEELSQFRQKFIGSSSMQRQDLALNSKLASQIVSKLGTNKKGREVSNYFSDMFETFQEMYRILKPNSKACIVIGNTQFKGVDILNAEVFIEQMKFRGFEVEEIIKREIPSKMLPSTRDGKTGQFAKATKKDLKLAYPTEYILVFNKS